jgi:hypothetical protein
MLSEAVARRKVERMQNTGGKGCGPGDTPSKAHSRLTEEQTRSWGTTEGNLGRTRIPAIVSPRLGKFPHDALL